MIEFYSSRSRAEDYLRCPRFRWEGHERDGHGYQPLRVAIPLATGGSVHKGLAELLLQAMRDASYQGSSPIRSYRPSKVDKAVEFALQDYDSKCAGRGLDLGELEEQSFVFAEQKALTEGLVRLAALRVVPRLLEIYEVLEVERMDTRTLVEGTGTVPEGDDEGGAFGWRVIWRSIPDALLRHRETGELYLLSWKTCGEVPRDDQARVDMQGVSEAWAIEERLAKDWYEAQLLDLHFRSFGRYWAYLQREALQAPRIRGVQMVYLVKGKRTESRTKGEEGLRRTESPLIYGWKSDSSGLGPELATSMYWKCSEPHGGMRPSQWYPKGQCPGGKRHERKGDWERFGVWQTLGVKDWMTKLEDDVLHGEDLLDQQWAMPTPNFRTEEQMRGWLEQTRASERRIAEALLDLREMEKNEDPSLPKVLNESVLGPQHTQMCSNWFGRKCPAWELCWGPPHIGRDPVGSGIYQIKEAYKPEATEVEDAG